MSQLSGVGCIFLHTCSSTFLDFEPRDAIEEDSCFPAAAALIIATLFGSISENVDALISDPPYLTDTVKKLNSSRGVFEVFEEEGRDQGLARTGWELPPISRLIKLVAADGFSLKKT